MDVFHAHETALHAPSFFMVRGRPVANEERAERADRLLQGIARAGLSVTEPPVAEADTRSAVHSPRYLSFLETAFDEWRTLPNAGPEVLANVQPRRAEASYPRGIVGRAGWHMGDLACPLGEFTWRAACRAADTAVAAARAVAEHERAAYAVCRPPGHHAGREVAAGHCFLNNAAIAAEELVREDFVPAILDIDVHHGNGTQAIFYERGDVFFVSVHTDPHHFYPWFVGHAHEAGAGAGEGANLNLPLPLGADDGAWLEAIDRGLREIERFGADVLVVSLGLDVHLSDPLAGMTVTTAGIRRAGERIGRFPRGVVLVQEGGYLSGTLSDNVAAFLEGFLGGRPAP